MPPTENSDGSALTNLAGYTVYYGTSSGSLTQSVKVTNPGLSAYTVTDLPSGTWYFAVTSYSSAGVESTRTGTVSTTYDDWGQIATYTDAAGQTTHYGYDLAGRTTSRGDSLDTTTLTYNAGGDRTGDLTGETDTEAGSFTAAYDQDGNLVTETYPGGTAAYTYDPDGTASGLSYTNANWSGPLSDSLTTNIFGDWTSRTVLGSSQVFGYDAADRLTSVADTQAGQCTQRGYAYDADSNRTSETDSSPAADGSCQSTDQSTTASAYDSADRLTNAGYTYDTLGDVTGIPSTAAGGTGSLDASYYANGMVAGQSQPGTSMSWTLDPTGGRTATSTGSGTGVTWTYDYADGSDQTTAMTGSDGSWVRNVVGPDSLLAASVTATGVTLELTNLHGDVMATETPGSGDTGPTATFTYSEFGTAETGTPGMYGWLGGYLLSSQAMGGQLLMGARAYSTETGRFDQVDPGAADYLTGSYDYVAQNPLDHDDLSGDSRHFQVHWSDWHLHVRVRLDKYYSYRMADSWWLAIAVAGVVAAAIPVLGDLIALLIVDMTYQWWKEEGWIERGRCTQVDTGFRGKSRVTSYRGSFCR